MLECGVDLVEIALIEKAVTRLGQRFLERIYTPLEREYCRGRFPQLAARFAAKEATAKILGSGLWREGVSWQQIEVVNDENGKPHLRLHAEAARRAAALGINELSISLTHSRGEAIAFVVASG